MQKPCFFLRCCTSSQFFDAKIVIIPQLFVTLASDLSDFMYYECTDHIFVLNKPFVVQDKSSILRRIEWSNK